MADLHSLSQKALVERYAIDLYTLPAEDIPISRPPNGVVYEDAEGCKTVRWGWDLPPKGVKAYFDAAEKYGVCSR